MNRFSYDHIRRAVMWGDVLYWADIDARPGGIIAEALNDQQYAYQSIDDLRIKLTAAEADAKRLREMLAGALCNCKWRTSEEFIDEPLMHMDGCLFRAVLTTPPAPAPRDEPSTASKA